MSLAFFIFLTFFLVLFVVVEALKRKLKINPEISRKITHIVAGVVASSMPFFISYGQIVLLTALFIPVMLISKRKNIFSSIHQVTRKTFGEIYFPISILIVALVFHNKSEFVYGVLIMSLSDALASVVGQKYGKNKFKIINKNKSYIGSLTFFIVSLIIGLIVLPFALNGILSIVIVSLVASIILSLIELMSVDGLDNLIIPPFGAAIIWLAVKILSR